jgi:hypothetical protein
MISKQCPVMGAHTTDQKSIDACEADATTIGICIAACGGDTVFNRMPTTDASVFGLCWRHNPDNSLMGKLSSTMTLRDFENGYWYVDELRQFARELGVPGATRIRKDELEQAIVTFLRTGKVRSPTNRALHKRGVKDLERGLALNLRIEHYTSNRPTKDFIRTQARKRASDVREKSGVWYRLNRWREEQITNGKHITYGDLVQQYIALNRVERFEKIPQPRYINFVAEFLAGEKDAGHADATAAWAELKTMEAPKTYASWLKARAKRGGITK